MILHLIAILLILGLAYLQMMQGLYSSIIMAVCTVFSAAIAMALFPWLAATSGMYDVQPSIADAVSFSLLFVGPLIGLRTLADKFIRSDIYFDMMIDRAGGAVFGLLSGTVMVGALLVTIQLAPFGRVVWGDFAPYSDSLERDKRMAPFFPDEFVVGFGNMISAGSMSSGEKLTDQHDNLLLEAFCARNTAGKNGKTDTDPGAVKSIALYDADSWSKVMADTDTPIPPYPTITRGEPTRTLVLRVELNVSAADDIDPHWWRLPATHFRLLCKETQNRETATASYYPVGYIYHDLDAKAEKVLSITDDNVTEPAKLILQRPKEAGVYGDDKFGKGTVSQDKINLVMDWVYVIPRNATPETLFFRRSGAFKTPPVSGAFTPAAMREKMLTTLPPDEKKRR